MANDAWDTAQVAKRVLMQAEEALQVLFPDGLFVAVARVGECHPEDPGTTPLAGTIESWDALEEIDLSFLARFRVHDAGDADRPGKGADVALHRFVAVTVAVLFSKVLPDALGGQTQAELLDDRVVEAGCFRTGREQGPGEHFGRISIRAGERFGRI